MDKQTALNAIAAKIIADSVCPELAATATQLVPGDGNPDADIMFVGEAPGTQEDVQGKPFVGAAGKLLTQMLLDIGFKREEVFITNIVKYRPPSNRDPLPQEIAAFLPYLMEQVAVIKPKLIIPLGRHAMSVFLPGLSISQCHGQAMRKGGLVYLPLYHPAVALYNPNMRAVLAADFERIPKLLAKIEPNPDQTLTTKKGTTK